MLLFKWLGCLGFRRSKPVVPLLAVEKYLQENELDASLEDQLSPDKVQRSEQVCTHADIEGFEGM